jgi:AbrB family looped-hinge helix DNA binding protein
MILSFVMNETVVTERGQVSVPASLRKSMGLHPGRKLHWEQVSDREIRISIHEEKPPGPLAVLGFARRMQNNPARTTAEWMRELREGE